MSTLSIWRPPALDPEPGGDDVWALLALGSWLLIVIALIIVTRRPRP